MNRNKGGKKMKEKNKSEEVKVNKEGLEVDKEKTKKPTTTEVKCVRRHLNNEYRRAIETGEVITVKSDYAKYLKEIGVVE